MTKIISCLCFCGFSIAMSGQSTLQTFTSPNRAFQFKYSPLLIRCTPPEGQSGWRVPDECSHSQDNPCGDMTGSSKTIVCFARPTHEYFTAAFFVAEIQPEECMEQWPDTTCKQLPVKLEDCLAGSWTWWPPETPASTTRGQSARIGSVRAKVFRISDSWAGGGQSGEIYRVFHSGKCYELGINEGGATSTPFDPQEWKQISKIAQRDDKKYGPLLTQALHSFRFVAASRP